MRVAIHQPNLFPRLKILQKLAAADLWVVLDSVQYCAREWQNRTRIAPVPDQSPSFWMTIPIHRANGRDTSIRDIRLVPTDNFSKKLEKVLQCSYRRAPFWKDVEFLSESLACCTWAGSLADTCVRTTLPFLSQARRTPEVLFSSEISVAGTGSKLIAAICRAVHATEYLADSGARAYLDVRDFGNIDVLWQHWVEPSIPAPRFELWRNLSPFSYLALAGWGGLSAHVSDVTVFR